MSGAVHRNDRQQPHQSAHPRKGYTLCGAAPTVQHFASTQAGQRLRFDLLAVARTADAAHPTSRNSYAKCQPPPFARVSRSPRRAGMFINAAVLAAAATYNITLTIAARAQWISKTLHDDR